jgi:hypothetical protein
MFHFLSKIIYCLHLYCVECFIEKRKVLIEKRDINENVVI